MFKILSAPISLQWELTSWCNHNCVQCYNFWRKHREQLRITDQQHQVCTIASQELVANDVFHVTLTGGEPLAVIKQLRRHIEPLVKAGITLSINTNLTLLTPAIAVVLKDLGIRSILTSLMASDPDLNDYLAQEPGAFKKTVAGIQLALASNFPVTINMVVMKQNLPYLDSTAKLARDLGARAFSATKASAPNNCPDFTPYQLSLIEFQQMLNGLLEIKEKYGIPVDSLEHYPACAMPSDGAWTIFGKRNCSAGKTGCTIGFDGQVRPCSHAHMTYGSVADGFNKAWLSMQDWRNGMVVPQICHQCSAYPRKCGGGCRIEGYNSCGQITAPDPYCLQQPPKAKKKFEKVPQVRAGSIFYVPEAVRFRDEEFGGIVYRSPSKWIAVDNVLLRFLRGAHSQRRTLVVNEIASIYGVPEDEAVKTISHLAYKSLVAERRT